MLTLKPHKDNVEICKMVKGRARHPIFFHPVENETLMNSVENISSFDLPDFRDTFELSSTQSSEIFNHLRSKTTPENNKSFFQVKRHIKNALMTSMDISDTKSEFKLDFGGPDEFLSHTIIASCSGAGKTWYLVHRLIDMLKQKKEYRRQVIFLSAEWEKDKTLEPLKSEQFSEYVQGIGIGHNDIPETMSADEYFEEIKSRCEAAPRRTILCFDDAMDSFAPQKFRHLTDRWLRTIRHDGKSLVLIFHSIKSGVFTAQGMNSIKQLVLFPRSKKLKISNNLNKDIGIEKRETRMLMKKFSQTGRELILRMQSPEALIGNKFIQLL